MRHHLAHRGHASNPSDNIVRSPSDEIDGKLPVYPTARMGHSGRLRLRRIRVHSRVDNGVFDHEYTAHQI